MSEAYVLVTCDLGSEESVIEELRHIEGVVEVTGTFGAYDVVAKISSATDDSLRQIITWQIRKIPNVRSTLTLMGIPNQNLLEREPTV